MERKNVNLSNGVLALCVALAGLWGVSRVCSSRRVDTTEIDKEIKAAQVSLDSVAALHNSAVRQHDVYKKRYFDLLPVVGQLEKASEREDKNAEWRLVRDSLFKYRDMAEMQKIAKERAQLRVDTLLYKRERMVRGL